ncbi:MAG: hypothetical protein DRZ80_01870 [Thermoprotei archaeon]|nr:MAG: hypothetical protein DRZ80_01870 [Thermoprotei archaeon]
MREIIERGVGGVVFRKIVVEAKFLNPLKGFSLDTQSIEYRKDPLFDRWTRINVFRALRMKQVEKESEDLFEKMVKESRARCPFCPERISSDTPMFTNEFIETGRFRKGSFILFPNYAPFAKYHCVGIISEEHYLELNEFSHNILKNCLIGCRDFFRLIMSKDPDARYVTINLNHLPPAAASMVHPHIQITQDYKPITMLEKALELSEKYYKTHGNSFWGDYVESEKRIDKRFIFEGDILDWVASFAPLADKEVIGVLRISKSCFVDLNDEELDMMAKDISTMFSLLYNELGVRSANMSIFSAPIGSKPEHFRVHVRIISRRRPVALYTNDRGFMEILHAEPVVTSYPEIIASKLRK